MTIQFHRDKITLECSHPRCGKTVEVRITRIGENPQAEAAMRRLGQEATRRGWDLDTDTCPAHR